MVLRQTRQVVIQCMQGGGAEDAVLPHGTTQAQAVPVRRRDQGL
jgi:hypothetical protein